MTTKLVTVPTVRDLGDGTSEMTFTASMPVGELPHGALYRPDGTVELVADLTGPYDVDRPGDGRPRTGLLPFLRTLLLEAHYREQRVASGAGDCAPLAAGRIRTLIEPAAEGEPVIFSWVPDTQVPIAHRRYVRKHVERVAKRLGLGPIRVRYFGPQLGDGDFYLVAPADGAVPLGVAPPDETPTIGLNAAIRGRVVLGTIAHECRHAWQYTTDFAPDKLARELDAERFEARYLRRMEAR